MTNMILGMIGILLAAAAALMTMFWGGDAFFSGSEKAEASRLTNEGAQIEQAISSYTARNGILPGAGGGSSDAESDLVSSKFLSHMPKGSAGSWIIDYPRQMVRSEVGDIADPKAQEICRTARQQQELPNPDKIYKCDGSDHPSGRLPVKEPCCVL